MRLPFLLGYGLLVTAFIVLTAFVLIVDIIHSSIKSVLAVFI